MNNEIRNSIPNSLLFTLILAGIIIISFLFLDIGSESNNQNSKTKEEYDKLANYTIKTTEDEYKLESNIYTNCKLFFPEDRNCTKELKIRIFNISRLP